MESILQDAWRRRGWLAWLLLPFSALFLALSATRRRLYRRGLWRAERLPVAVVVVGNITAGGAGKTPLCLWLVDALRGAGRRPGIVSRGYGGAARGVVEVGDESTADQVGDEPLLLRRRGGCPVFVGRDRVAAAGALLAAHPECDVVIADDGLQHYRLARDVEIAVLDRRGLGNGWLLPAGPLREPPRRLREVDALVLNGTAATPLPARPTFHMRLEGDRFHLLGAEQTTCRAADLSGLRLHACAGIGAPQRFFDQLISLGLDFVAHAFPDHHRYARGDLAFADCDALLVTEKDAIKCAGLSGLPIWVLPVTATLEPGLAEYLLEKIDGRPSA